MNAILEFLRVQGQHVQVNLTRDQFASLVPAVDCAYETARMALPGGGPTGEAEQTIWKLLLLCHRSFLLAVCLSASGHPDDSGPITRRAVEMARLAFALSYDPENMTRWVNYEARSTRWDAWSVGAKPPHLEIKLKLPPSHALLDALGRWLGIYSEATVHITPELLSHYPFEARPNQLFLSYFVTDRDHLDRTIRTCVATHVEILRVFDEALGEALSASRPWCDAMQRIVTVAQRGAATNDQGTPK